MTAPNIMTIGNYATFGLLAESWALGQNLVDNTGNDARFQVVKPSTVKDGPQVTMKTRKWLEDELSYAACDAVVPTRYTQVLLIQSSDDTLVIKVPEQVPLQVTRGNLGTPNFADWSLPKFYRDTNGFKATDAPATMAPDQKLTLFASRIGDYTVSVCL